MTTPINYKAGGEDLVSAFIAYKESPPDSGHPISLASFAAGFNAAKTQYIERREVEHASDASECDMADNIGITPYTVSRCNADDELYGPIHSSSDAHATTCGRSINHGWWIITNGFDGPVTCKKCLRAMHNLVDKA